MYCLCVNVYCTAATVRQPNCSLQIYKYQYQYQYQKHQQTLCSHNKARRPFATYIDLINFYNNNEQKMAANCKGSVRHLFSVSRLQSILIELTGSRCNSNMAVKDPKI